jgi:hypothetical protein
MQNLADQAPGTTDSGSKKSLTERAVSELERYAVISAYLWLLFALFSLHRQLLQGHGISLWQQGFAIINALVFGKVILIGEAPEPQTAQIRARLRRVVVVLLTTREGAPWWESARLLRSWSQMSSDTPGLPAPTKTAFWPVCEPFAAI